jgi:glycosyltransferase involved in cell wall biosynthesis
LLFHAHSYLDRQYARQLAIWSLQVKRANVIAASAFVAGSLQPSLPAASMKVIYSGVGDSLFRPRSFGNHPPRIAIVGRISPEKGHLDFVAAAKRLVHARPDARFLVLGATLFSDDSYERRVRECAGGALIEFRGWTGDVPGALHEIDVLAVPSAGLEAAPRVVLEAFAAGTPVVAYPSGGIPEFVRHGETGVLTDSPHADALASSIEWLISKPELMTRLSGNARLEWEQRFTLERYRREVCDFIEARFAVNLQNRQALRASGAMARR